MGAPYNNKNNRKEITWEINENGCWICTSHITKKNRYARYFENGKRIMMHRYMYQKYKGKISDDMCVCHKCDNPRCINPNHLFIGTQKDNMADMIKKGRQSTGKKHGLKMRGANNGSHKLTENEVKSIKYDYPYLTRTEISKIFNISIGMVCHILNNRNWKYI
jgi:hypothetical protein